MIFTILPTLELEAKDRINRQIKRIKKYMLGQFSASRIDDTIDI